MPTLAEMLLCVTLIDNCLTKKAIGIIYDVRDYTQVCAARYKTVETFGSIDIMANFAGGTARRMLNVGWDDEFPNVPIDVFDWRLDVNLKGPFYFAHAVLKQMRTQNSGLIINIGSITGAEGDESVMDYSTAKAGLMFELTKSIMQYSAKYNIRCNCISPGPVLPERQHKHGSLFRYKRSGNFNDKSTCKRSCGQRNQC